MNRGISGSRSFRNGFTLIELMIAVAVVAILALVALPSYRNAVIRSNRADAQQNLLQLAQLAERDYVAKNSYATFTIPDQYKTSPLAGSGAKVYDIAFTTTPAQTSGYFRIRATPVATGVNKTDGFLEIDSQGIKRWDRNNNGTITPGSNEENWSR